MRRHFAFDLRLAPICFFVFRFASSLPVIPPFSRPQYKYSRSQLRHDRVLPPASFLIALSDRFSTLSRLQLLESPHNNRA